MALTSSVDPNPQSTSRSTEYWRQHLAGFKTPNQIQVGHLVSADEVDISFGNEQLALDPSTALHRLAEQLELPLHLLLEAGWAIVLTHYTGDEKILFGRTLIEEATDPDRDPLPLRISAEPNRTVRELLHQIKEQTDAQRPFIDDPLADIQPLNDFYDPGQPLFENGLTIDSTPLFDPFRQQFSNTQLPLTLSLEWTHTKIGIHVAYNRYRFEESVVRRMLRHYLNVLKHLPGHLDERIVDLPLMSEVERSQLLIEWNSSEAPYPDRTTVTECFIKQAEATPNATALIFNGREMSYAELHDRSTRLAHRLVDAGVGPEIPVGIAMFRSFDMIIGLIATIKAGGAYVPLDPNYPAERLSLIIEDTRLPLILSTAEVQADFPESDATVINLDQFDYAQFPDETLPLEIGPDSTLFVTFTSGSTGRPKGVQGHHRGLLNRCQWQWDVYPIGETEICSQKTTLNFVDHLWEIWGTLLNGSPLLLIPDEILKDAPRFLEILGEYQIERIVLVPSFIRVLMDTYPDLATRLPNLKYWTFSGEPVSRALADRFRSEMPHATILDFYGMSEATLDATWYDDRWCIDCATIPIGKPIANMQVFILDRLLRPVPVGVPGEIYVGGVGLSRGYWGRDDLTAERFIPNHLLNNGTRLYKSGDMGRWLPDGYVEYIGRADNQVKIRGFRIEPGEIEAAIRTHPAVNDCVVIAKEFVGDKRLIGFVLLEQDAYEVEEKDIKAIVRTNLPDYMVPSAVVFLKAFPRLPNGKINKLALPEPSLGGRQRDESAALSETEATLIGYLETLLETTGIHPDDNYFDIGGHSLMAVRYFSMIEKGFGINLPLTALLQAGSVRELATLIDRKGAGEESQWTHLVPIQEGELGKPILFFVHGAGGNVLVFKDIVAQLDRSWTFIGIQASGVDGVSELDPSVEIAADKYLAEVRQYQPVGPYIFGGMSGGGVLAMHMAQTLQAQGESVPLLVFLDTHHPHVEPQQPESGHHLRKLREQGISHLINRVRSRFEDLQERVRIELATRRGDVVPFEVREGQQYDNMDQMLLKYDVQPYTDQVLLFLAEETWEWYDHVSRKRDWDDLIATIELYDVPGDHNTIVEGDSAVILTKKMVDVVQQRLAEVGFGS